ncbi:MAG: hypothetical protein KF770_10665 [Anaerolineae bacterium]|nr:hypothetical protein [Anaerolineae bacterium]
MKCEICGEAVTELSSTGRPLCQAHKYGMAEPRPAVVADEPVAPGALPEPAQAGTDEAKAVRPKANKAVKPAEDK